jgi:hypothetical protein
VWRVCVYERLERFWISPIACNSATSADRRGFDLISDALPFGRLWYGEPNAIANAIGYAKFFSRSQDAVIRVYDGAGNVMVLGDRFA